MADTLRIKRRLSGAPGGPSSMANAELAFNEVDNTLYYGLGTGGTGGTATGPLAIGGPGMASNAVPLINGTAAAGSASAWSRGDHIHPTDTTRAPIASPTFTGIVTISGTITGAGMTAWSASPGPIGSTTPSTGAFTTLTASGTVSGVGFTNLLAPYAPLASPAFTGTPTAPTVVPTTDSSTKLATTAFVQALVSSVVSGVSSITAGPGLSGGGTGAVTVSVATAGVTNAMLATMPTLTLKGNNTAGTASPTDLTASAAMTLLGAAPLASPSFTGVVTIGGTITGAGMVAWAAAPGPIGSGTPSSGAFTTLSASGTVSGVGFTNWAASPPPIGSTTPNTGNFTNLSVTGTLTGAGFTNLLAPYAPLNSPNFTGTPSLPTGTTGITQASGNNSTALATTQFVLQTRLDQMAAPTNSVNYNNQYITNLHDPQNPQDGATKNYVDNSIQGIDAKGPCLVATTGANISLSGTQTIDGIAVVVGNRVLVKDQSAPANNGIYIVAATAWTRSTDLNTWAEIPAAFTFIEQGTVNADTGWLCTADPGGTLGTTAINWVQFSAAGQVTAGNGLQKVGNVLNVVGTASRIAVGASVDIDANYVGQASITTLGTVSQGTWNATTIAVNRGGTGATSLTGYVSGNGTSAFTASTSIPNTAISGLGTMSTQFANNVAIIGGTIDGITFDMGTF